MVISQSDTELGRLRASILGSLAQDYYDYASTPKAKANAEADAEKELSEYDKALVTKAKNELLQELLEQKQDLIFSNGIRREAVPVQVIEKYLAKGDA